ncbi:MAG: fatty acid desaturase [Pirellulales bacterium]|nr:fatty acid desaturase [Pirellulales bacterium]
MSLSAVSTELNTLPTASTAAPQSQSQLLRSPAAKQGNSQDDTPKQRSSKPLQPRDPWERGIDWGTVIWFSVVHLGALAAPFYFTWKAVALFVGLYWLTGGVGICLGYHRLLTHGSFQTYRPMKWLIAFVGGLAGEGSAVIWVANHRKHHAHSDKEGDPHSPRDGGLWSHMLWFMPNFGRKWHSDMGEHYAPDLMKDPVIRFLDKTFLLWFFVLAGVLFTIGYVGWDAYTGWSFVVWGMFVRMVWVYHVTWFVNSATHIWGYRNYETTDDSKNLWWVGLLAWGEGWHNNHHAYQRVARYGHKWWEIDFTYYTICAMEKLGLAWNVVHKVPAWQKPE